MSQHVGEEEGAGGHPTPAGPQPPWLIALAANRYVRIMRNILLFIVIKIIH
jgi:hypothetical protein